MLTLVHIFKLDLISRKDVRLPVQMQRAMAAEAESTRDARAKVIDVYNVTYNYYRCIFVVVFHGRKTVFNQIKSKHKTALTKVGVSNKTLRVILYMYM